MKLGEIISTYLNQHGVSANQFAKRAGYSRGYISMLINESNPRTGKAIKPGIDAYANIAKAMDMTVYQLMALESGEQYISMTNDNSLNLTPSEIKLLNSYRAADVSARKIALQVLESNPAVDNQKEEYA